MNRSSVVLSLLLLTGVLVIVGGSASAAAASDNRVAVSEAIELKAPDGVMLKASYFSAGKPGPAILMLHACNRDRSSWALLAGQAAARGYHVLALDFRGFGESGGPRFEPSAEQQKTIDSLWPGDVDTALAWLSAQNGVDKTRIAAAGASCGVNQSVQLARRHPEVRTVVLLSGGVNDAGRAYLRDSAWLPVFASASHGDAGAVETMKWLLGWSRNPDNKFLEYKAAGHGTDMLAAEKGLEPAILTWFDAHLRNTPAAVPTAAAASAKPTEVEEFWKLLNSPGGIEQARKVYAEAKARNKSVVLLPETETNLLGYQLLQANNAKDAVTVFQMNVDAYPDSANTYDSLSDGYLALGSRDEALKYAEKALQLLPKDNDAPPDRKQAIRESAEKKIKDLKAGTSSSR